MRDVGLSAAAVNDDVAQAAGGAFVRGCWELVATAAGPASSAKAEAVQQALWVEARRLRRHGQLPSCSLQRPPFDNSAAEPWLTLGESGRALPCRKTLLLVYCDAGSARAVGRLLAAGCPSAPGCAVDLVYRAGQPPQPLLSLRAGDC